MKRVTEFKTVLLIEPIHRYRLFLEGALRDSEFELVAASGPEEVLSLLKGMTPHLILTEDNISGCEVTRFLLQLRELGLECPLIIMSTQGSPEHIRKYASLSVSDFLIKPIDEERLLRSLRFASEPSGSSDSSSLKVQPRGLGSVLIADDIGASRRMLADYLKKHGYTPIEASGGVEAVNRVVAGGVDVLLLDYQMRDINGLEVLQDLRMRNKALPTIMVSAHATQDVVARARLFGAVDFIQKPIDFPLLINRLKEIGDMGNETGRPARGAGNRK